MRTQCLTCKRHVYDLDEMTEFCQAGQKGEQFCKMYKERKQYTKEIADRWRKRQKKTPL